MSSFLIYCGICDLRHITKPSLVWCLECDEGLCHDCSEHHSLSKASRNHNIIPISEYRNLPGYVISIKEFCAEHNETFQTFCKKHDSPCCRVCVVEQHNKCEDIVVLESVIGGAKTCNTLCDNELLIKDMLESIKQVRKEKEENMADISNQRKVIQQQIEEVRLQINNHLDRLLENLIKDLMDTESKLMSETREILSSLNDQEKQLIDYQNNISDIKKYASDLKTFLSMKKIEKQLGVKDAFVQSFFQSSKMYQANISLNLDSKITNLITELKTFGKVEVNCQPFQVTLMRSKNKQAQLMATNMLSKSIDSITVELQQKFQTGGKDIRGCKLLPDNIMAFSDYADSKVLFFKSDGSNDSEIKSQFGVFDIVYIEDDNSVAATSGGSGEMYISIVDIENKKIKQTIPLQTYVYGIGAKNKQLFFCARKKGLQRMNLDDRTIKTLVQQTTEVHAYMTTFGENLYYTNKKTNTVICCNLEGKQQWIFNNENCLKGPLGISADYAGNVYVVGNISNNVVVLSPDGQRHREILSFKDGLLGPRVLHYEQRTNQLLVANKQENVFRYKVS